MRRFYVLFCLILILILLLSGCANETTKDISIVVDFSATVEVTGESEKYICEIINTDKDISSILIKSPESLNGINYKWNGNSYEIKYNDLYCQTTVEYLPQTSFASILIDTLKYIKSPENINIISSDKDLTTFIGENQNGKLVVDCNTENGLITSIQLKDLGLNYEFSSDAIN